QATRLPFGSPQRAWRHGPYPACTARTPRTTLLWQTMNERMRDSAFATNIDQAWTGAVAGYYGGPSAFNIWSPGDWKQFAGNRKLPIWVAGLDGAGEGKTAIHALRALGVPAGAYTAVDMENRVDKTYVDNFGHTVQAAGYTVWVYGSASSVFSNPRLNG